MDTLTTFERRALDALLLGEDPALAVLRKQAAAAEVSSREETGVGFFTDIAVPAGVTRLEGNPTFKLGDVSGATDDLHDGFGLLLHVSDGLIRSLEAYAFEDRWPEELRNVTFRYIDPAGRDFDKLKKLIHQTG